MFKWINKKLERKSLKVMGGIPLLWLLYQPDKPKPNMGYRLHPSIRQDEYLKKQFKDIADYFRANYTDEWEHLEDEKNMMKPEEAIKTLKARLNFVADINIDAIMAYKLAIKSLEKEIAKTPLPANEKIGEYYNYICPNDECGKFVDDELYCCDKCGQRLEWE